MLDQRSHPPAHLLQLPRGGCAEQLHLPLRGTYQPTDHAHKGGLACPVRPHESKNIPFLDGQSDMIYCARPAILFGQPRRPQNRFHPHTSHRASPFFRFPPLSHRLRRPAPVSRSLSYITNREGKLCGLDKNYFINFRASGSGLIPFQKGMNIETTNSMARKSAMGVAQAIPFTPIFMIYPTLRPHSAPSMKVLLLSIILRRRYCNPFCGPVHNPQRILPHA